MVSFAVDYESGITALVQIDAWTLSRGHWVVPTVVRERQESGDIPPGKVVTITRIRLH
jgi:hypothetical protein